MGKPQLLQIVIRITCMIINGIIVFYFFKENYVVSASGFFLLLILQLFLCIDYIKKLFADIEKSMDCLLYEDYSNTISKEKRKNPLHNKTALLLEKHRKLSLQKTSEQIIFTNIIESLSIGLLILRKDSNENIEVFQINKAFVEFLQIPKFHDWNLLKTKIGALKNYIDNWNKVKQTVSLTVNNDKETFFLKTSVTKTNEYNYIILSLETIQQLIDKKEKEAWYKLMNVMSHEIINTITPISSLAENLDSLLTDDSIDDETVEELSEGLQIIKRRSYHLTSFVDTYRKLAELPLPNKKIVNLTSIVKNTISLFDREFKSKGILISYNTTDKFAINADKEQIEQVIINLISNCIYAVENISNPKINISVASDKIRTYLKVTDNGIGIADEIKDNIFIPYFTTRKNGSGIGLTLTKSIVEAHNGIIQFESQKGETCFTITFKN
ncbi:sensor histidine kinase [Tenacibaculum sp. M341]|uniref:sensor histidine kinase n=1 Tax=Tenacibaculum sp. M341 TaxID=2530339 RepID=UPI0010536FE5|nr:HAMP domain-containing sensor histidine kinase [Tenacibaculum sp. M341]TCI91013.1 HAMP domain-containing histidine kinase [Tenacibaculum sp. M341]